MQGQENKNKGDGHATMVEWNKSVTVDFDPDSPPPKTRGEKIFNAISWGFFGWIVNAAASIKMADWWQNRMRPYYMRWGEKMAETAIFKGVFKDKHEAIDVARSFSAVVALLPGGYTVLAPIKFMEDRKVAIVKTLDRWFGPKLDENDRKLAEARYEYLDTQPKISWGNLVNGRTLPVLGVLTTHFAFASHNKNVVNMVFGDNTFQGLDKYYGDKATSLYKTMSNTNKFNIGNLIKRGEKALDASSAKFYARSNAADKLTYHPTNADGTIAKVATGAPRSGKDRMLSYTANTMVDMGYSAGVAAVTFLLSHLFAFKKEVKKDERILAREGKQAARPRFQLEAAPEEKQETDKAPASPKATVQLSDANYHNRIDATGQAMQQGA